MKLKKSSEGGNKLSGIKVPVKQQPDVRIDGNVNKLPISELINIIKVSVVLCACAYTLFIRVLFIRIIFYRYHDSQNKVTDISPHPSFSTEIIVKSRPTVYFFTFSPTHYDLFL